MSKFNLLPYALAQDIGTHKEHIFMLEMVMENDINFFDVAISLDWLLLGKVESLESDLKQTKLTYGTAFTKLIMKVKRLEKEVKLNKARRRAKSVVSDDEDAE
ncbi:hypothetical protein Tco_1113044 [Tanacetum coccineum]|uniref:Uncharacterized protein n=1 Tax=Tanacetum coccineum TaxID=301880 RepID=A0ABQ5ISA6_9ASTR